jgi:hypothetical protein
VTFDHGFADADHPNYTDDLCDHLVCRHQAQQARAANRLWRAIMLSPTIETCEALLKTQPVPRAALDPIWARRLGL